MPTQYKLIAVPEGDTEDVLNKIDAVLDSCMRDEISYKMLLKDIRQIPILQHFISRDFLDVNIVISSNFDVSEYDELLLCHFNCSEQEAIRQPSNCYEQEAIRQPKSPSNIRRSHAVFVSKTKRAPILT